MSLWLSGRSEDEQSVRDLLLDADVVPLSMVLVHLTGCGDVLDDVAPFITGPWPYANTVPANLKATIVDRLMDQLKHSGQLSATSGAMQLPDDTLNKMLSVAAGAPIPSEYLPLALEELNIHGGMPRQVKWRRELMPGELSTFQVAIIGAGISGLCIALQLKNLGIPFVIFEKNSDLGGTWYENCYPGCGVDTPNHFYSYSFFPNPNWSRHYSGRDEILAYLKSVASKYQLSDNIRLQHEVISAKFDESVFKWEVITRSRSGEKSCWADVVISCVGQLNRPTLPSMPGLDSFRGPKFHTAAWDHSITFRGAAVSMIGTGASAMQVGPSIAPIVKQLNVIQRTPHWARPVPDYHRYVSYGTRWAIRNLPFFAGWMRFQLFWGTSDGFYDTLRIDPSWPEHKLSINADNHNLRHELIEYMKAELGNDQDLLAKVVPDYPPYGKRMLRDNNWYKMLRRPNVRLITDSVQEVTDGGLILADGDFVQSDVIVFATGFQATRMLWPMEVRGRNGVSIRDVWGSDDPRAFLGISVPRFPNLFLMYGPNTSLVHGGSIIFHAECQARYIAKALRDIIEHGWRCIECRSEAHDRYNEKLDTVFSSMIWSHPAVKSWYKNEAGRVAAASPWKLLEYWRMTLDFSREDYIVA